MPYQPASYSPALHRHLHIEDYRFGRANILGRAAEIQRQRRYFPAGSAPYSHYTAALKAEQRRMADLRSICNPIRQIAIMERDLAAVVSPSALSLQADEAAMVGRAA